MSSEMVPDPYPASPFVANMLAEFEIDSSKPFALSSVSVGERREPLDGLSARELEVLRYLPTMLTAGEIAAELYVSVNTVKAHTRSIYRKLGASRRRVAVVRAYECGILSPSIIAHPRRT